MCAVSYVGDYWRDKLPERHPWVTPTYPYTPPGANPGGGGITLNPTGPSQAEFDALKKEVEELKKLLLAAKKFDEETGQPDCHMDEKVDLIKKIAKLVGVDMKDVFGD